MTGDAPLRIGFVGAGFIAHFHLTAFEGVRDARVAGVFSPTPARRRALAERANALGLGPCQAFDSLEAMLVSGVIDAVWVLSPNDSRVATFQTIHDAVVHKGSKVRAVACEKPLARTLAEATEVLRLTVAAGLAHGYLENQVFSTAVQRGKEIIWRRAVPAAGRPYLARAAEEHSGPHMPWFWRGELQGGGVLNDMMCHSVLLVRHLLTAPGAALSSLRLVRITARIASLKWTRPFYSKQLTRAFGRNVNYEKAPSEDFASATLEFETDDGQSVIGEASTSWSFVGAGLRVSAELLGPEYSMSWNTLDSGLKVFFSRAVRSAAGEDLLEKQNAEIGLMPVVANEAAAYGYENEDRHFVRAFLGKEKPLLTFDDGLEVVKVLMAAYQSAEQGKTLAFPPRGLDRFVPAVARGKWKPQAER
jgi:predicted dehydrogenase